MLGVLFDGNFHRIESWIRVTRSGVKYPNDSLSRVTRDK